MKKAKIMLASIAVLSIVGGALAFKAKSFNIQTVCYNTSVGINSTTCTTYFTDLREPVVGKVKYHYTVTYDPEKCKNGQITCPSTAETIPAE